MEVKGIKANLSFHEVMSMECNNMFFYFCDYLKRWSLLF